MKSIYILCLFASSTMAVDAVSHAARPLYSVTVHNPNTGDVLVVEVDAGDKVRDLKRTLLGTPFANRLDDIGAITLSFQGATLEDDVALADAGVGAEALLLFESGKEIKVVVHLIELPPGVAAPIVPRRLESGVIRMPYRPGGWAPDQFFNHLNGEISNKFRSGVWKWHEDDARHEDVAQRRQQFETGLANGQISFVFIDETERTLYTPQQAAHLRSLNINISDQELRALQYESYTKNCEQHVNEAFIIVLDS